MPDDFDLRYTPKFYESFGKVIQLDLGSTAQDVATTRERVTELPQALGDVLKPTADSIAALRTNWSQDLAAAVTQLKASHAGDIGTARDALKQDLQAGFQQVLAALQTTTPVPVRPALRLNVRSADVIRPLTQILTLGVDAAPGQPDKQAKPEWGENVTLKKLAESVAAEAALLDGELHKRFLAAFRVFSSKSTEERHQRYAEVHALIEDIAAQLS
ncbi:hypothetical protein [Roseateles puraquae]|jgi:hypothetical protein|uniref:hypothetical protein n=1 Tax=Roseateles puraquae TaxID=431059 RepID=UPI0031E29D3A